ncbi:hypothetical protein M0R72_10145 [Candidatus Pacearchaeota archaeon]|jgi:hypothetical protein|nr:hypothetical protein [Candidatus Pacearchaeota archaeon]
MESELRIVAEWEAREKTEAKPKSQSQKPPCSECGWKEDAAAVCGLMEQIQDLRDECDKLAEMIRRA